MKAITREWIEKAEADYAAAVILRRSRKKFSRDLVCFHLQQSVEKYLKARLEEAGTTFPKTHDLETLLSLIIPIEPMWAVLRQPLAVLSAFAVAIRYPGRTASAAEATRLMKETTRIRGIARQAFGLT